MKVIDSIPMPARFPAAPAHRRGWMLLALALSLLLHLLFLAAAGNNSMPVVAVRAAAVTYVLTSAAPVATLPAAVPAAPPEAAPARPRQVRRRHGTSAPLATDPAAGMAARVASTASATALLQTDAAPASASEARSAASGPAGPTVDTPPDLQPVALASATLPDVTPGLVSTAPAPAAPRYRVDLPPSATLSYEVRYATRGSTTRGSSTVAWRSTGDGYAIRGEVSKFGLTLSAFRSEGGVDDAGIAPVLYAEKNATRAATNTYFQRDARQKISFSAATDSFPLQPGAQDRASILWQLAGIARGQGASFVPGTVLDVVVAGVRDAEPWRIEVIGEETVSLDTSDAAEARAWHLLRAPRAGTNDKRIDIWLAPGRQWYPVKLRYTEQSGDTLELSLSALH